MTDSFIDLDGDLLPEAQARVGVLGPAVATATTVFETLRFYRGDDGVRRIFRLDDHLDRLAQSMALLRYAGPPDRAGLVARIHRLIAANGIAGDGHLRLYVFARAFDGHHGPVVEAGSAISAAPRAARPWQGLHAQVSRWRRPPENVHPARAKCVAGYLGSRLALLEAREAGFDDAIMLDHAGMLAEAPIANLAMVHKGRLATPDANAAILLGLTRDCVLRRLAPALGLAVEERAVAPAELDDADEVLMMSTGYEIAPVTRIDHRPVGDGAIGPLAGALAAAYGDLVRGRAGADPWLTPVAGQAP